MVKATPMQKLQVLVDQVHAQLKPQPQHFDAKLLINGREADLGTPLRFANLASNVKLEIRAGRPTA